MKQPSRRVWLGDTRATSSGASYFGLVGDHLSSTEILSNRHKNNVNFIFHDGHYAKMNLYKLPFRSGWVGQNDAREQGTDTSKEVPYPY